MTLYSLRSTGETVIVLRVSHDTVSYAHRDGSTDTVDIELFEQVLDHVSTH